MMLFALLALTATMTTADYAAGCNNYNSNNSDVSATPDESNLLIIWKGLDGGSFTKSGVTYSVPPDEANLCLALTGASGCGDAGDQPYTGNSDCYVVGCNEATDPALKCNDGGLQGSTSTYDYLGLCKKQRRNGCKNAISGGVFSTSRRRLLKAEGTR